MSRFKRTALAVAGLGAALAALPASAGATGSLAISLTVPVLCKVSYSTTGAGGKAGEAVMLGQLKEYCNAGSGYRVVVDYPAGSMRGAVLQLGDDRVTLDGSGEAVLSSASGPRIRTRNLMASPGANGFDTAALSFELRTV
jgi:hypothetical protein